jgi:hypothetical protein
MTGTVVDDLTLGDIKMSISDLVRTDLSVIVMMSYIPTAQPQAIFVSEVMASCFKFNIDILSVIGIEFKQRQRSITTMKT